MKHLAALLVKFVIVFLVLFVVMTVGYQYPLAATFGISLFIVVLSYIIGDLGILSLSNNLVATISDLALITIAIGVIGPMFFGVGIPFTIALVSAFVVSIGEWFFHKFMFRFIIKDFHKTHSPKA